MLSLQVLRKLITEPTFSNQIKCARIQVYEKLVGPKKDRIELDSVDSNQGKRMGANEPVGTKLPDKNEQVWLQILDML